MLLGRTHNHRDARSGPEGPPAYVALGQYLSTRMLLIDICLSLILSDWSQVNFHVALSPVTQGSKPFLVWETPHVQRPLA